MKIILIVGLAILAILGIIVVAVLIIGSRLPEGHVVSRSVRIKRPLNAVYEIVRDVGGSHKWRPDVTGVEMLGTENGQLRYRETGSNGVVTFALREEIPDQQFVTQIVDTDLGYSGSWTYRFSSVDGGTEITITENGKVSNLLFRVMSRYVFGHTSTIDAYLTALARHFGESPAINDGVAAR